MGDMKEKCIGWIINILLEWVFIGGVGFMDYLVVKVGLIGFMKFLVFEFVLY